MIGCPLFLVIHPVPSTESRHQQPTSPCLLRHFLSASHPLCVPFLLFLPFFLSFSSCSSSSSSSSSPSPVHTCSSFLHSFHFISFYHSFSPNSDRPFTLSRHPITFFLLAFAFCYFYYYYSYLHYCPFRFVILEREKKKALSSNPLFLRS